MASPLIFMLLPEFRYQFNYNTGENRENPNYIVNDSYSDVCFRLAECYHYGIGTEKDLAQALFFAKIVRDETEARLDRGDMYGGYLYPKALKEWQDIVRDVMS